jgi:outer membrane protein assembly factor BamE (lipoprotein component of BamABCDE complex)
MTVRSTGGLVAILLLGGLACAPPRTDVNKGNLTMGAVQTHLENGKTTKAQVLEWFGSPNIATKDKNGEVWNYTRQGTATEVGSSQVGAWMLIASAGSSTGFTRSGSYSFDLLIRFDTHDVVVDYKVLQTAF